MHTVTKRDNAESSSRYPILVLINIYRHLAGADPDLHLRGEGVGRGPAFEGLTMNSKWFEPRSISSSYSAIVQVRVAMKRTVVGDCRFDNLCESHLQSQVKSCCQTSMMLEVWSVYVDWSV